MTPRTGKSCYRCERFVVMSGPEAARDPNTWTLCHACRAVLNLEAELVGKPSTPNAAKPVKEN